MAHSIENRVPFLDHELVEYVRGLPTSYLVRAPITGWRDVSHHTKIVLKRVAARRFGDDFAYRSKGGFDLPLTTYFSHPRFRALMEDELLPGMRARGLVSGDAVERWWRRLLDGHGDAHGMDARTQALWAAVAFELWAQQWLDGSPPPVDALAIDST